MPTSTEERVGLLIVNLETPDAPRSPEVRRYLRQFLSDPRVLDTSALARFLVLELLILPTRPKKSAEAYAKVWGPEGSPLLVIGRELAVKVQARLGEAVQVELAMRYGNPSIESAVDRLERSGVTRLVVFLLYPEYSSAATGSSIEEILRVVGKRWNTPYLQIVPPFYDHPAYIEARAAVARPYLDPMPERVFMSFHGLPERQIRKSDPTGGHCLAKPDCCAAMGPANRFCYRAQCFATARALTQVLGIPEERVTVCFQSRLGRTPWLTPATDQVLAEEAKKGVRWAVIIPSFVTDCLETLEELSIRGAETWHQNGGETLQVVPAVNADDRFVEALIEIAAENSTWLEAAIGRSADASPGLARKASAS
ncbi:MAG TPA: ferrochelatase [Thermoanaerobaculia bacterium]|nr:ferrochelatase [Thermoanaerobaculia bacterium]